MYCSSATAFTSKCVWGGRLIPHFGCIYFLYSQQLSLASSKCLWALLVIANSRAYRNIEANLGHRTYWNYILQIILISCVKKKTLLYWKKTFQFIHFFKHNTQFGTLLCQSKTLIIFFLSNCFVDLDLCFSSTSCWKVHVTFFFIFSSLTDTYRF